MTKTLISTIAFVVMLQTPLTPANAIPAVLTVKGSQYTLGPGDKLKLSLFGQREFDTDPTIDVVGNIAVPLLGSVHASGKTISELSNFIELGLTIRGYYNAPI